MYSDVPRKRWPYVVGGLLAALLVAAGCRAAFSTGENVDEEGAEAIAEAVRRSALQCYVVEGVYPPDLEYLQEHYGLRVNTADYYVIYDSFASNLPPDVRVTNRK